MDKIETVRETGCRVLREVDTGDSRMARLEQYVNSSDEGTHYYMFRVIDADGNKVYDDLYMDEGQRRLKALANPGIRELSRDGYCPVCGIKAEPDMYVDAEGVSACRTCKRQWACTPIGPIPKLSG